MARRARRDIIPEGKPMRVVCVSQCVQQMSLCEGVVEFKRRRIPRCQLLVELIDEYSRAYTVEVQAMVFLPDGWIMVLHLWPNRAAAWSDEEVLRRAWIGLPTPVEALCRKHHVRWNGADPPPAPLLEDKAAIEKLRQKLQELSLLMQVVKQRSAIRFNREADTRGAFWAERYFSFPISDQQESMLIALLTECLPQVRGMVQCLEQCSTGSGWDRVTEYLRGEGMPTEGSVVQHAVWLNARLAERLGVPTGLRTYPELQQQVHARSDASPDGLVGAQTRGSATDESSADGLRASGRRLPTVWADPQRLEALVSELVGPDRLRKPLTLAPTDCRPFQSEGLDWHQVRGVGPVTLEEWVAVLRWAGPSWCAWRLANIKDKQPVANVRRNRKRFEDWIAELLESPELSEAQSRQAIEKLQVWLTAWGRMSGLASLSSVEQVQCWVERLFGQRGSIDGTSNEIGQILGLGSAGVEALRGVLRRVDLSLRHVVGIGEATIQDVVRTLREVTRSDGRHRSGIQQVAASRGSVVGGATSSGEAAGSPDTS